MLVLTERAIEAVRTLVAESSKESAKTGVRIRAAPVGEDRVRLDVRVVQAPAENDYLLEEDGARVYLEQGALLHLDDKVLDAKADKRKVVFSVSER